MTQTAMTRSTDWLASADLRPTRQRVTLATLLVGDGQNRHVTAEGLFDAASKAGEKVSLATVYNTLKAFCDAGLMREITVDGSKSYFDTNISDHPHFYWEDDQRLTDAILIIGGLFDQLRPDDISKTGIEPTISDFYHTTYRDVFVGSLCAIGVFLVSYRGHRRANSQGFVCSNSQRREAHGGARSIRLVAQSSSQCWFSQ